MKTPGVLESTRPVVDGAEHVQIDRSRVQALCREWARNPVPIPPWDDSVHFSDGGPATANYILLLDALNFCFWPDPGQPRWTIDYQGRTLGGYLALAASLKRGIEEGLPLLDADWLAQVTPEQLQHVFRGEGRIPMLERRIANAREAGQVLKSRYGGSFARAIESCQGSAVRLVELLEREFSSFCDVATWKGRTVRILKRAQITPVDLYGTFGGAGLGHFSDLDELTAFADYKTPGPSCLGSPPIQPDPGRPGRPDGAAGTRFARGGGDPGRHGLGGGVDSPGPPGRVPEPTGI